MRTARDFEALRQCAALATGARSLAPPPGTPAQPRPDPILLHTGYGPRSGSPGPCCDTPKRQGTTPPRPDQPGPGILGLPDTEGSNRESGGLRLPGPRGPDCLAQGRAPGLLGKGPRWDPRKGVPLPEPRCAGRDPQSGRSGPSQAAPCPTTKGGPLPSQNQGSF